MARTITLSWWQFTGGILLLALWFAGDYWLLLNLDASALDCLPGESVGRKARMFETLVCHPLLIREGPLGWLAVAWFWGPLLALWLWLRSRRQGDERP